MKYFVLYLVFTLSALQSNCQIVDTPAIIFTAKLSSFSNYAVQSDVFGFYRNLKTTSYSFLKQNGFKDVIFIKIKIRPRIILEEYLFYSKLSENEHRKFILLEDYETRQIIKDTLRKKYNISDTSENDKLESLLPNNSEFYDTSRNLTIVDYYFAYLMNSQKLILLGNSRKSNNSNNLADLFYKKEIISSEAKKYIDAKGIPKNKWKNIVRVDEFDISKFLGSVPD